MLKKDRNIFKKKEKISFKSQNGGKFSKDIMLQQLKRKNAENQ